MSTKVIDAGVLVNNHCLSTSRQPYYAELLEIIQAGVEELTIVVGAGASMASGLPSWPRLIDNLVTEVGDAEKATLVERLEAGNLFRKAEIAVQLLRAKNPNRSVDELVRDALYPDGRTQSPGLLVEAVVRLAVAYGCHVRLVTTNFDDLIEQALNDIHARPVATSHSLDSLDAWRSLDPDEQAVSVLHLHGMVRQADSPLLPLLLTESDFLAHGREVQDAVTDLLTSGVTLFVGLSMADPNLLGPLYRLVNEPPTAAAANCFALFTPDMPSVENPRPAAEYAVVQATYLAESLGLKPILLKTFAQPAQLVSELGLATVEPDAYRDVSPVSSLSYGKRFERAMTSVYTKIGVDPLTGVVEPDRALEFSRYLQSKLDAPGGPLDVVNDARELLLDQVMSATDEKFSAYFWLRRVPRPGERTISLGLVASSTYVHWQPWTGGRIARVWSGSEFNVAKSVFFGSPTVRNQTQPGVPWRGYVALPITADSMESGALVKGTALDRLLIGAIALDTTGYVDVDPDVDTYPDGLATDQLSPIARMTQPQLATLFDSLTDVAQGFMNDLSPA